MNRRVPLSTTAALALALGCAAASPSTAQTPAPTAGDCQLITGPTAMITVDGNGVATPPCIEISKQKKTTVEWVGKDPVVGLDIDFKAQCAGSPAPAKKPKKPKCKDAACSLKVLDYQDATEKVAFCYTMVVTVPGQSPKTFDPKLIINP